MPAYPDGHQARDHYILSRRPARPAHNPWRAPDVIVEDERAESGSGIRVATVFLTGRECPWRCLMCDLWQHTIEGDTPAGAIAAQVTKATRHLAATHPDVTQVKLYNAGSFFDPRTVPPGDYGATARAIRGFERIVVESHPALIGARTAQFLAELGSGNGPGGQRLEVAIGLETTHPGALQRLNKRMTVADFERGAATLHALGAALRVFLLIAPPFVPDADQDTWLARSIDVAVANGATAVSLIPTRRGNGAIDALHRQGVWRPPQLADIERSALIGLGRPRRASTRVFVDLWDLGRFSSCDACLAARRRRLDRMNLDQRPAPPVVCAQCDATTP